MNTIEQKALVLRDRVIDTPRQGRRRLVAIIGAPASGKSTLADVLAQALCSAGCPAQVVPMDGFHLHNQILVERELLNKKGAPETFDAGGLLHLVKRLHDDDDVFYPLFDRQRDISIAGAGYVDPTTDTIIVEGNYLLLDAPVWRELSQHWDLTIMLDVPMPELRERLLQRWLSFGLSRDKAIKRAEENDLANAQIVATQSLDADFHS